MERPIESTSWLVAAALPLAAVCACEGNLDTSLNGKLCSSTRQCLAGYVCSRQGICVTPSEANPGAPPPSGEGGPATTATTAPATTATAPATTATAPPKTEAPPAPSSAPAAPQPQAASGCDDCGCPQNRTMCGNTCADLASDPEHCGSCAKSCGASMKCMEGVCVPVCAPGRANCHGVCIDTSSDPSNCSTCGHVCKDAPENGVAVCQAGRCTVACRLGLTFCKDRCVNTMLDPKHCGDCETECEGKGEPVCIAGYCISVGN